jgi:hypothetical protein
MRRNTSQSEGGMTLVQGKISVSRSTLKGFKSPSSSIISPQARLYTTIGFSRGDVKRISKDITTSRMEARKNSSFMTPLRSSKVNLNDYQTFLSQEKVDSKQQSQTPHPRLSVKTP